MPLFSRIALAAAFIAAFGTALPSAAAQNKRIASALARLDKRMTRFFQKGGFVGLSIGVVTADGTLIERHYGAVKKGGPKPRATTLFRIGSLTKLFTATLALRLRDEGVWSLAHHARRYAGGIDLDRRIRLLHLLTHTSGLPHLPPGLRPRAGDIYNGYTTAMLRRDLPQLALDSVPGLHYRYSNLGFGVLGFLASRAAKRPFAALLRDKVLLPLGLKDTVFELSPEQRLRTAPSYQTRKAKSPTIDWKMGVLASAGGLYSTLADLARFVAGQWTSTPHAPLSRESVREMQLAHFRFDQVAPELTLRGGIGLAWHLLPLKIGERWLPIVWHNGVFTSYRSFIGLSAERRIGVIILSNTAADVNKLGLGLLRALAPLGTPRRTVSAGRELRRLATALRHEFRTTPTSALESLFHPTFTSRVRKKALVKLVSTYASKLGAITRAQLQVDATPRYGELILHGSTGAKLHLRIGVDARRRGAQIVLLQPLRFEEARR
ncbi:MAG: beta-lactamase family protein [Myxococcales bacterium]|nr:beta-lactamase family protein [Myxococcales bacterium]